MKKFVYRFLPVLMLAISNAVFYKIAQDGLNIRTETDWNRLFVLWMVTTALMLMMIIYWIKLKFDTNDRLQQIRRQQQILSKIAKSANKRETKKGDYETSN